MSVSQKDLGGGNYLSYEEASNGSLFINWKAEGPGPEKSLAYFLPGKTVPKFKYTKAGGKEELTRSTDSVKKNFFQGWTNFVKMAREFQGQFVLLGSPVSLYFNCDGKIVKVEPNKMYDFKSVSVQAVACFAATNETFEGAMTMDKGMFIAKAQEVGAGLPL